MPDLRDVGKKSKEAIGIDKLSFGQVENAERKEYEMWDIEETTNGYSRFFSLDNWFSKNINQLPEPVQQTFPFMIVPKASKSEKNDGLESFEEHLKQEQILDQTIKKSIKGRRRKSIWKVE